MGVFVTAYLAVWLAVALYVQRLAARQSRIEEDLNALRLQIEQSEGQDELVSKLRNGAETDRSFDRDSEKAAA